MSYYRDLRELISALDRAGRIVRIKRPVNKDTELHPLVKLQYRGLPEGERKAFLFENVIGKDGRRYPTPVLVGAWYRAAPARKLSSPGTVSSSAAVSASSPYPSALPASILLPTSPLQAG